MPDKQVETRIALKVHPGARRNEVSGFSGDALVVKVAAPPEKGKANAELIAFLAGVLGVRKSDISILRGEASRNKVVSVRGLGHQEIAARLDSSVKGKQKL
ncbi:MAG: DUF167 domain-containing protein [Chloroflexi bacterium]|nr:DUF167 domain-containing protein [Chloroflexota bacterium]